MSRPKQSIAQELNAGQLAISNSLSDPAIQSLVAQFGYPAEKLNEGKALYDAALAAVNAEKAQAGGRQESTRLLAQAEEIVEAIHRQQSLLASFYIRKIGIRTSGTT